MASLGSHFSAFLFLFPIGIRRLLCCFSLYLQNPSLFRSKAWYFSDPRWKTIDLYILLIALPIASFSEFFLFLTFSGHPTYRFAFFQKSILALIFWVLVIVVILREYFDPFLINESLVFGFAGIAFLIDSVMTETEISGSGVLGVRVYELLAGLNLLCASSCFYLAFKPSAFFAEVGISLCLAFKGTWTMQAGLSLYTDAFSMKGCHKFVEKAKVQCDLEEDGFRGVALINLLFIGHAIGVLLICVVLFGALTCNRNLRCGEGSGPSLADIDSESLLMRSIQNSRWSEGVVASSFVCITVQITEVGWK